jgi:cob(I)alamin adenosyltransferase
MIKNIRSQISLVAILFVAVSTNAQFVNFEETWKEFLTDTKTSDISKLVKPSADQAIDYAKWCMMYGYVDFCANDIGSAEKLMREIKKVGEPIYAKIPEFKNRYEDLEGKIEAYHETERLWQKFLKYRNVTLEDLEKAANAKTVCEKGTLAKYFYMTAAAYYCKGDIANAKDNFENRVLKLAERTSLEVKDVQGLEVEVATSKQMFIDLPKLGKSWKEYTTSDVSPGFDIELPVIDCYSIPNMKAYVLRAAVDICKYGAENLAKIQKLQSSNSHPIDKVLQGKIDWLESEVGRYNGDIAKLDNAWKEFVSTDTLKGKIDFMFEYCEKEAQVRALTMYGTINACTEGQLMLDSIAKIRDTYKPNLDGVTETKISNLEAKIKSYQDDVEALNLLWAEFIVGEDTLLKPYKTADFYCDKIAQVKSWTIKGMMDECAMGQHYLDAINALQKSHSLKFDEELACRVLRLQIEVWDCRYWELVLQARKETHAERESFGPASAKIMQDDLNSDKQPCETTVFYKPLGNIGIQYIISTYLCQEIDLAKMGDPEYYKKIASWVDTEVLSKYCEANMRCKEDFFIYLEGHTDGHPFKGASYKKSLDIPEGTPFTHFSETDTEEKTVSRDITTSLRSNMELGIARAWTVKQQLDFMGVPTRIGAFEHPVTEKGGEYRKIDIELNITNLLLDFYEKRLQELWDRSGIGARPDGC